MERPVLVSSVHKTGGYLDQFFPLHSDLLNWAAVAQKVEGLSGYQKVTGATGSLPKLLGCF